MAAQTLTGLALLVGAAQLFVTSIDHLAHGLGVEELILTLIIAPLATKLPEKLNSVLWMRQARTPLPGQHHRRHGLQSMPLVAFGMVFTGWRLTASPLLAMVAALVGTALSLLAVRQAWRWPVPLICRSAGLYIAGITAIIAFA